MSRALAINSFDPDSVARAFLVAALFAAAVPFESAFAQVAVVVRADTATISGIQRGSVVGIAYVLAASDTSLEQTVRCTGTVIGRQLDTILVNGLDSCPNGVLSKELLRSFRVRFDAGLRSNHAAVGLLVGLTTGAVLGKLFGPRCVLQGPCAAGFVTTGLVSGAELGAVIGTIFGLAQDAGEQWRPLSIPAAIHFSGVDVQPGLRLSRRAHQ